MDDFLMIGTVLKPQGVRGECKIRSWAADISRFNTWKVLYMKAVDGFMPVAVEVTRISDGFVFAHLDGSSSANEAEKYRGTDLYVDRDNAAPAEKDATLIADLIGCTARDENGTEIGVLTDVLQHGTVDTWVFRTASGTLMAPALLSVFPAVDPENKAIDVIRERLEEVAVRS
ncbi:MAG: ribosome maturation factor RimM [Eubacteriales bacterium]